MGADGEAFGGLKGRGLGFEREELNLEICLVEGFRQVWGVGGGGGGGLRKDGFRELTGGF